MKRNVFQTIVRRILKEEISKRLPEMNGNGLDSEKKNKVFSSDPNSRDTEAKNEAWEDISKAVKSIDSSWTVVWDDHDDLMINGGDIVKVWITPLWEDNFKIVFMPRNEERYFFTSLTWPQVIEFVKENLKNLPHTNVERGRDRSWRNSECQTPSPDKGLPQKDKPKTMSTDKPFSKEKNRDKRYTEDDVKNEKDLPNMPLREVGKIEKQISHKVKDPVKLRKRLPDKKLVIKQK